MRWNTHSHLDGAHAFLSPSAYHWINYTDEKLAYRWKSVQAALRGSEMHRFAATCIEEGLIQDDETTTLGLYINQCIQYRMRPEQVLFYSPNCFGTVDAISYRYRRLRISDLKTGISPASEHQLEVYAALFCLEYHVDPFSIREIELRIYQENRCRPYTADPNFIKHIMDKIISFDKQIDRFRKEDAQ